METKTKIAIIDSGLSEFQFDYVKESYLCENGMIRATEINEVRDINGHGTAITDIITRINPQVELFVYKVFHKEIRSSFINVMAALEHICSGEVKLINLSMGTKSFLFKNRLLEICEHLYYQSKILIASAHHDNRIRMLPAIFSSVLGVSMHNLTSSELFFNAQSQSSEIMAPGINIKVPDLYNQSVTMSGTSYACAHVTAVVSKLVRTWPQIRPLQVRALLFKLASKNANEYAQTINSSVRAI